MQRIKSRCLYFMLVQVAWMANGQVITAIFAGKQKLLIAARIKHIAHHLCILCYEDERASICSTIVNKTEYKISHVHHFWYDWLSNIMQTHSFIHSHYHRTESKTIRYSLTDTRKWKKIRYMIDLFKLVKVFSYVHLQCGLHWIMLIKM